LWLATHRSDNFARLRERLNRLGVFGDALSTAELGPFAGAPRNPQLKIGAKTYAAIRYAERLLAYTTIHIDLHSCRRCEQRFLEVHRVTCVGEDGVRVTVGTVRICRSCQAVSWMFYSRMPSVVQARMRARKVVL
jgi:hypothetical protein